MRRNKALDSRGIYMKDGVYIKTYRGGGEGLLIQLTIPDEDFLADVLETCQRTGKHGNSVMRDFILRAYRAGIELK